MQGSDIVIDKIVLRGVAIPLHEPFRIANGSVSVKESIVVEIHGDGIIGYGEASPMAGTFYSSESPDSTWDALANDLVPDLLMNHFSNPIEFASALNRYEKEPFARAGIEGAVWHFASLREHTTIGELLGLSPKPVRSGLALGLYDTIEELLDRVRHFMPDGYQRLKIKIEPGWDIEPLRAIRKEFGNIALMVDANASYDLRAHEAILKVLDSFDLLMIEQPLVKDAFEDAAELQKMISTPICADESADSAESLNKIIALGSAKIINIKVQRVGGLWNAKRMYDRAYAAGLRLWLGTMPELGIATAQALQLGGLTGFYYPSDIEASDRWFIDDIIHPAIVVDKSGLIQIPSDVGMGYEVDRAKLENYTTQTLEFN